MTIRDKSILTGLYLSKFSQQGMDELGFSSFQQAFNVLGYTLGSKPTSIKNYRDEFDPYFSNNRKGWHKRPMREYCKIFFDDFKELDFKNFSELIKSFLISNYKLHQFIIETLDTIDYTETVAKRLLTGKAAEEYFKNNFDNIAEFNSGKIIDTTNMACGFDFQLTTTSNVYCVEVKGLNDLKGGILLTEKEFYTAQKMRSEYCLFIVKNFREKPEHEYIFNPLESRLNFKMTQKEIIQTSYTSQI